MKNYFLAFALAILVVLTGFSLKQSVAGIGGSQMPPNVTAIGGAPVPDPPDTEAIGGAPVPDPPDTEAIGGAPVPDPPDTEIVNTRTR